LVAYAFTGTSTAANQSVQANGSNQFTPAEVTVDPGDTVTWQYAGGFGHTVTSTGPNWSKNDPLGPPSTNLTTTFTFDKPGRYTYVCTTHESVGMRGTVIVTGTVGPTKPPPPKPTSPRPTGTRTSQPPTRSASPSVSTTPAPSASSARPPILPSGSLPPAATTKPPVPTVAPGLTPEPSGSAFLGAGGLTVPPPTGRAKGLPVMLALLLIGGVGSAEVRALLANAPE
jgi:plastocyanin